MARHMHAIEQTQSQRHSMQSGSDFRAGSVDMATNGEKQKFLLYGKNGWIGGMLIELIKAAGDEVVFCKRQACHLQNTSSSFVKKKCLVFGKRRARLLRKK